MIRVLWLLLGILAAVGASDVRAQLSIELRGGGAIGNHAPAAAGLELLPGPSGSASVDLAILPRLSIYGTYTYGSFLCEEGFCSGQTVTITSSGFGAGVRIQPHRLFWARAGALYHGTEVETDDGTNTVDPAPGYEIGAGIAIPLQDRIDFVTGASYRSHIEAVDRTSVLAAEAGIRIRLLR